MNGVICMTEKRFKVAVYDEKAINGFTVLDLHKPNSSKRLKYENVYIGSKVGCDIVCKFGNELADENEQLKQAYAQLKHRHAQLKHRHSLLYDVCIDAECDRDSYCKDVVSLEKENKRLIKMLDNVANYMQKQHKEVPIDDFVEWWNKIAIGDKDE